MSSIISNVLNNLKYSGIKKNYNFLEFENYLDPTPTYISTNNKSFKTFPSNLKLNYIVYNAGYKKYSWRF